jgi:diguanylate cyclase (GGDEF)-like protein
MPIIHLLLPDQNDELRALESETASMADFESACRLVVTKVAASLESPVALLDERSGRLSLIAEAGAVPPADTLVRAARRWRSGGSPPERVTEVAIGEEWWTAISLRDPGDKALLLMVAGDWTLSRQLLQDTAARLGAALKPLEKSRTTVERGTVIACTLPRRLARARNLAHAYQIIIDACAKAVGAEKGSIAVYDSQRQALSVTATYGYPAVLVKHLRFRPGEGIIGTVYHTRQPLCVDDIRRVNGAPQPRLRYRSTSFMSVPLFGANEILGVISVTDRHQDRFNRRDFRTLRSLAAIASLALDRSKAQAEATAYARVAAVDPLTGLFNRRYFLSRLDEEAERARRQSSPLSVLMLDVDNFKQLNDRLGHLGGDSVLRVVGDVLHRSVRLFDVCARYGGDEFAILMPGSGLESTRQVAERIREGVEDSRPPGGPWSEDLRVTTSIGIATFVNSTSAELIGRADQALYVAKREGKNRVRVAATPDSTNGTQTG